MIFQLLKLHLLLVSVTSFSNIVRGQYEPYGENVAFGKPANQSTTYSEHGFMYTASLGVDGRKSTQFIDKTCSHTGENSNHAYWIVDLQGFYFVKFIRIYQWIHEPYINRLNGSELFVRLNDGTWQRIYFNSNWPPNVFNVSVNLDKPIDEIMLNNDQVQGAEPFICICELEAFKVLECSPYSIGNGSINVVKYGDSSQPFSYGTTLNVTCNEGYRMADDGMIINEKWVLLECNATGNWTRKLRCSVIECGLRPTSPSNSVPIVKPGLAGATSYNATLTIVCNEGFFYTYPGRETIHCGDDGFWEAILGKCDALHQIHTTEKDSKIYILSVIILGPLCSILLITNIVTCLRLHRHVWFKTKKRQNIQDHDVTMTHKVATNDPRLQVKDVSLEYDCVPDVEMENMKSKSARPNNNAMEPYDNLVMDNRAMSEYDKLKFAAESSLKTTMANETYQNIGLRG